MALTFGLMRSIRARWALTTSRADTCLRARRAASSTALRSQSSSRAAGLGLWLSLAAAALSGLNAAYVAPAATVLVNRLRLTPWVDGGDDRVCAIGGDIVPQRTLEWS